MMMMKMMRMMRMMRKLHGVNQSVWYSSPDTATEHSQDPDRGVPGFNEEARAVEAAKLVTLSRLILRGYPPAMWVEPHPLLKSLKKKFNSNTSPR